MSALSWLVFGHLIGDWLLQNDWMAMGKRQRLLCLPGLVHAALYTACILGAAWAFGGWHGSPASYLVLGGLIFISHWLIDGTRLVEGWMRFYRQSDLPVVRLMVDQTLHLVVLAVLLGLASMYWPV
jgi:hypothetical protein